MARITIFCPECKQRLAFDERPGYQDMLVQCPKCGFKARVNVYMAGPKGPSSPLSAGGDHETETQIFMPPASASSLGQIRVISTGEIQYLKSGNNIIGRRAKSGTADIKISTDMTMSRRHIDLRVVPKGNGYEHLLVALPTPNPPKINGRPVQEGDVIKLRFGDTITLGSTDIKLESNDDDATRLNA